MIKLPRKEVGLRTCIPNRLTCPGWLSDVRAFTLRLNCCVFDGTGTILTNYADRRPSVFPVVRRSVKGPWLPHRLVALHLTSHGWTQLPKPPTPTPNDASTQTTKLTAPPTQARKHALTRIFQMRQGDTLATPGSQRPQPTTRGKAKHLISLLASWVRPFRELSGSGLEWAS